MKSDQVSLANQICFSVYNAYRLFNRFYKQTLQPFGLTYSQYLILRSLWQQDRKTLHEIGDELHLSSNTLTPLLKKLEVTGWIQRHHPDDDKRQLVIILTEKGKRQEIAIHHAIIDRFDSDDFDAEQYHQILEINQKLISKLTQAINR